MLPNQCFLFIGLLFFYLSASICFIFSNASLESICFISSNTSMELPLQNCSLTMKSHNFHSILSWKLSSNATRPSHYTVFSINIRLEEECKAVENCINITKTSCNLIDSYEVLETYYFTVAGFNGTKKIVECAVEFFPITQTILDPPEVSIFGFKDTINVTVHHPASLSNLKDNEKEFISSVVIKVKSHDIVDEELKFEMADREYVETIIDSVIPNSNYCISAYWDLPSKDNMILSPLKCIMLSPSQESGSEKNTVIPYKFVACFIIFPIIIFGIILKKAGYICTKKTNFPKSLNFSTHKSNLLQMPHEKVTRIMMISKTKKKKMSYDSDDKSDSDYESTQSIENNYATNGFTCRSVSQDSKFTWREYNATGLDPNEPENPETDPSPADTDPLKPNPDVNRICHNWSNLSGSSTFSSRLEDCFNFNVNLRTVFIGDSGDDKASEEDSAQIFLPVQEDKSNLVDADGTELKHLTHSTHFCVPSEDYLSSENASSDESVNSESNVDLGDGYIRR
ncbi:interferon alpha/beta receptor 2-like isoform X1 [Macrotis lagotis]|uniref:interferon alpha/beta receptor 2-like isoform X1 n=1 Tax=Macrotis lagotis TaxID=92651 RepID=UPI003D691443